VTAERSDDLPARVRAIRKQRGLTQQQFAEAAGVGYRSYQNFENGVHRPQPANMRLILDYAALESDRRRGSEIRFTAGADIRAGDTVTVDPSTGMLVPVPYDGRREAARDQTVIELLCQTLERTGFRTMNGETFEEWARARVAAGDYPDYRQEWKP
jgi:transcriptional regulator with XRE-family HTH domain